MSGTNNQQELQRAFFLHQQGSLREAADLYRQLIARDPDNLHALHYLGLIEAGIGNLDRAKALIARSISKRPVNVDFLENYATILCQTQDYEAAVRNCRQGLEINDKSVALLYVSAISLFKLNKLEESLTQFDKLLLLQPKHIIALNERGSVLAAMNCNEAALASVEEAIALEARYPEAHLNKGNLCCDFQRYDEAISSYDRALALKPSLADAWLGRGNALHALKRFDEAIAAYDRALELSPIHANAWVGCGNIFWELKRYDESLAAYDRAIAVKDDLAQAWLGRGNVFNGLRRYGEALTALDRAIELKPDLERAWHGRGHALFEMNRTTEALAAYDQAISLKPNYAEAISGRIFVLDFAGEVGFEEQQRARNDWWQKVGSAIAEGSQIHHDNDRDPDRRIKVGYVSADFRAHAAARSFRPMMLNHDKSQFEITCYSSTPVEDEFTKEFRLAADRWRDVARLSDDELFEQIRADQIDILVDLSGHSLGNRLGVFARKPAPVTVTAWGHATGTGLPTIDYFFSDPVACPAAVRHLFAEKVFDLPCLIPPIEPLPQQLLPSDPPMLSKGYVTFGVFNRLSKISDQAVSLWSRILNAIPRSRILIKHYALEEASMRDRQSARFAAHGIAAERTVFLGTTSRPDHLAAFKDVDISLDPFPQNGGISTLESLQMGVPVVAKLGNSIPSRLAGAILASMGMDDWVADNDDDYSAIAVRFASASDRLKALRYELPTRISTSAVGNPAIYTKAVETAYRKMWTDYCRLAAQ